MPMSEKTLELTDASTFQDPNHFVGSGFRVDLPGRALCLEAPSRLGAAPPGGTQLAYTPI